MFIKWRFIAPLEVAIYRHMFVHAKGPKYEPEKGPVDPSSFIIKRNGKRSGLGPQKGPLYQRNILPFVKKKIKGQKGHRIVPSSPRLILCLGSMQI